VALDQSVSGGTRGERCKKIGEVRSGVESPVIFECGLLAKGKGSANVGGIQWVAVGKRRCQILRRSAALQVSQDRVASRIILLEVHRTDLD
jgi:hypothetical protein